MKEFKFCHTVRYSASLSLMVILLIIQAKQSNNNFPFAQVTAQSLNIRSSSKTNELSSSKFRESFSQFRKEHQPVIQQQVSRTNQVDEQQVIEQPVQHNQFFEQQQRVINNSPQQTQTSVEESFNSQQQSIDSGNSEPVYGSVKGTPGVDFPNYSIIPNTKFSCDGVPFEPGMYADESTGCQVYHLCYQGRRESFLCGIGTVFNQAIMNCDFWHSVDCSKSSLYYGLNAEFGKSLPEPTGGNFQSSSQTSVSQFEQSQIPSRQIQQHQKQFTRTQQSSVVLPSRPSFARSEQNVQSIRQFSGGKISLPKQQQSSSFFSQVSTETNSIPPTAIRESGRFDLQRNKVSSNFVSPGRKAAQLSGVKQDAASAESSPMKSFASGGEGTKSRKVGSSLEVNNFNEIRTQSEKYANTGNESKGSGSNSGLKLTGKSSKSSLAQATKSQNLGQSGDQIWKPYFRSKTKPASLGGGQMRDSSIPAAPVNQGTSSTPRSPVTQQDTREPNVGGSTQADAPLPTVAQPDQEPTFSSDENSSPAIGGETTIPKSSVPPTTTISSNSDDSSAATSVSSNVESDVGADLSTTTPATTPISIDSPTTVAPTIIETTTETPASEGPTEITSATSNSESSPPSTEKSDEANATIAEQPPAAPTEAPTTTTVTSETTQSPSESESASTAGDEGGSSSVETAEEKKRKRGVLTAGVEYAEKENVKKQAIIQKQINSSSVEYVSKEKS